MRINLVSCALLLSILSCGKSSKNNDDKKDSPQTPPITDGKLEDEEKEEKEEVKGGDTTDTSSSWYGIATKCLVDAEEVNIGGSLTVKQKVACSPIMSGASQGEVTEKLDNWKEKNCNAKLEIRNGTPGNWQGCSITAYEAHNAISNNKAFIDQTLSNPDYCSGKQGANYGSVRCSGPR